MKASENAEYPLPCLDGGGEPGWTCQEFDGTGLWCANCLDNEAHDPRPSPTDGPASTPTSPHGGLAVPLGSGPRKTLRLLGDVLSFEWWHWRRWTPVALYDDDSPNHMRAFYYRFWGFEWGSWQIGVRRAVKP